MRSFAPLICTLICVTNTLMAAPLERSISTSRQFVVYGASAPLRGTICDLAEKSKANLLAVLQQRDHWKTPIIVHLQFPQANLPEIPPAVRYLSQTGAGLKIQLDLIIHADVDPLAIQRELLRATLLEMIYRGQPDLVSGTVYVQPHDWLVDGLLAGGSGQDRAPLIEALAALLAAKKIIPLEEFLRQKPEQLDSPARLLYRACSLALVQMLINEPGSPSRFSAYIDNLSRASNDPLSDLKAHFPVLSGADNIETLWQSGLAKLGAANTHQVLGFAETERKLNDLLRAGIRDSTGKTVSLESLLGPKKAKLSPAHAMALNHLGQELLLLGAASNPVLRPIVAEYQQIAQLLLAGKRNGLAQRFAQVKVTRERSVARMTKIDDYMNWFEATQSNARSETFTEYLKAAGRSAGPERRRRDALSVYLDAIEGQFPD